MPKSYQELTPDNKATIRKRLQLLIDDLAAKLESYPEAVATEMFYHLQRHRDYGRNATPSHKNASYSFWEGICQKCRKPVSRDEAKFHHLQRGIPNQHAPQNLVPQHSDCHDDQHGAVKGSLSKGSPKRKAEH